jgi:CRISPR-associated RAMP protein (TIGR02581 family)
MFDRFDNRVILRGTLTAQTALRIGAGRTTGVTGTDLPIVRDTLGKPYIPGSSFKGALRALVEALVRSINASRKAACNPVGRKTEWCLESTENLTGDKDGKIVAETCLVCRVFGSPWLASKINIRDLLVDEKIWFGQFEVRNGVAIDRDTETAADGKLYDFEVVPAGTRFNCEIVIENAADWELGLAMLGLRSFDPKHGGGALGGGRSRGLGVVTIEWSARTLVDKNNFFDFLIDGSGTTEITDEQVTTWIRAAKERIIQLPAATEGANA